MDFIIYDTFSKSLERLNNEEMKLAKITAMDLQLNPGNPGHQFHKIDRARDSRFCTIRASRDLRIVVYKDGSRLVLCYADHHDKAYRWAQNRRFEPHPVTGSAQIVEVRERVEEVVRTVAVEQQPQKSKPPAIQNVSDDDLLAYGIPQDWLIEVKEADEDGILEIAERLPAEAQEAVLKLATGERPELPPPLAPGEDPFSHPDAQRSFRVMSNREELERALEFPWERWIVYLHPAQRDLVKRTFNGPARVAGSAGTGKTIVALHRAAHLARTHQESRVLLTTFSETLAQLLQTKLHRLLHKEPRVAERVEVHSMQGWGKRLYESNFGKTKIAAPDKVHSWIAEAAQKVEGHSFSLPFLKAEWKQVLDDWQLRTWEAYRGFNRRGRKTRISEAQRETLWAIYSQVQQTLRDNELTTESERFSRLADHFTKLEQSPYDFLVVDEAQDIRVAQLRLLAALAGTQPNGLFLCGDLGQRIFQAPFSWKALGVNIQGRSRTLKINYRTSHQIRSQADQLLDPELSDLDGNLENRKGTVSVFNGPKPELLEAGTEQGEIEQVSKWLQQQIEDGSKPREIGVFVRSQNQIPRAEATLNKIGLEFQILDSRAAPESKRASVSTMHLAKGLEFRTVVVMACDEDILPLQERIETASDESELVDFFNTERHLLYVACTRARDRLLVSCVSPGSEFIKDLA